MLKLSLLYHIILKCHFKFLCKSIKYYFNKQGFLQLLSILSRRLSLDHYKMSGKINHFQAFIPGLGGGGRFNQLNKTAELFGGLGDYPYLCQKLK